MKILCVVGSPRKKGNTDTLMDAAIDSAKKYGAQVEKIYLSDLQFKGCIGCEGCAKTFKCVINDDMQIIYNKIENADGIILGSPTYYYNVTSLTKMFIDRLYAYNIFDSSDRSVWISKFEAAGIKYAVTIAVCEQETPDNMGFASSAMHMALQSVGIRSVYNIKALHLFKKHEAKYNEEFLLQAQNAATKLCKTIALAKSIK